VLDGEIQSLVAEKGFGFIKTVSDGTDVFFHRSIVDVPFETLVQGQQVKYELDPTADRPRARCVQAGKTSAIKHSPQPNARPSRNSRPRSTRGIADREAFEHGFVTKLYRKRFHGFISSTKHGPEYLFAAASVSGEKCFSRLEIGDFVQFLAGDPDPADPKQPVAIAVRVVEREVKLPGEQKLKRHPKARGKKPTWR
jgi:cold shock CspA family protein